MKSHGYFYKLLLHYYKNFNFCCSLDSLHESKFDSQYFILIYGFLPFVERWKWQFGQSRILYAVSIYQF